MEIAALEEALPDVLHAPLHFGLVLGVSGTGRVSDETSVLRVFQEALGEARMQRVWSRHRWREIIDHQVLGHSIEESPRRLQSGDDVLQLLALYGPHEAMPRVAQYDDHGPHRLASSRRWVRNHAQPTEVRLRHLTRRGVLHPHRGLAAPTPVAFQNETAQRRIRYCAPSNGQQLLDAGQLQPVAGEPLVDLIRPGLQQILPGRRHSPRPRLADASQPAQLLRIGRRTVPGDALRLCRRQVLAHRITGQTGTRCDFPRAYSRLPAANDLLYLHSGNLPVRHLCTSNTKCGNGRRCGSPGGSKTLKIPVKDCEHSCC